MRSATLSANVSTSSLTTSERAALREVYEHGGSRRWVELISLQARGFIYATKGHAVPYRTTIAGRAALRGDL